MRAIVVVAGKDGPELLMQNVPQPEPGPHDLLVRTHAIGLNRADLARVQQHYAGGGVHIAGLEAAGEVVGIGAQASGFAMGDRVMAMCAHSYADYVLMDARLALPVPAQMPWQEAAAMPVWFLTAHDAVATNGRLAAGEHVLIQAVASGVGLAQLQVARALGAASVLGSSRNAEKLARIKAEFGLDVAIEAGHGELAARVKQATGGAGADVIIDNIGGPVLAENLEAAALRGRIVSVGRLGGKSAAIDLDLLALKRLALIGVTFRTRSLEEKMALNRRAVADLWPLIEQGRLRPIVDRSFALEEASTAQDYMKSNQHLGKVVLIP